METSEHQTALKLNTFSLIYKKVFNMIEKIFRVRDDG